MKQSTTCCLGGALLCVRIADCTWEAYKGDRKVPKACNVLSQFSSTILTDGQLSELFRVQLCAQASQKRSSSLPARRREELFEELGEMEM